MSIRFLHITNSLPAGYRIEAQGEPLKPGDDIAGIISRVVVRLCHGDSILVEREVENRRFLARTQGVIEHMRNQAWDWHHLGQDAADWLLAWEREPTEKLTTTRG
ncbi:MAG: hypothetical protein ACXIUZ_00610 [Lysobacteraceae bacterium]